MNLEEFKRQLSYYAKEGKPFVFAIDFECQNPILHKLENAEVNGIYYNIKGLANSLEKKIKKSINLKSFPVREELFNQKFQQIKNELNNGNTYLLNLTFPSKIETNLTLEEIFHISDAPYKFFIKDQFVSFSPECFIKITNGYVLTYPMKGTIDANLENAEKILMENDKEKWEHNTIVDLMRNDIAMITSDVTVEKYRYVEKIATNRGSILQTSSEIKGKLPLNWKENLGESIVKLLPAGSISGAPKQKTVEIIKTNELLQRGYYTGIFGIFDGENLDSAVAIRFIENRNGVKYFRSGGGITAQSNAEDEYNELRQKIYIPTVDDYPLFETICIQDGEIQHLVWHEWRYKNAFYAFYGVKPSHTLLSKNILIPLEYRQGTCKLRVRYNKISKKNEFEKYKLKKIASLKIVHDNTIDYGLKYTNRTQLKSLYKKRGNCDDVLIIKNGLITDSSSSNIVFFDGKNWITPSTPLLKGTARERLINAGMIKERKIPIQDLTAFQSFKLINAMRCFETIERSDIKNILK